MGTEVQDKMDNLVGIRMREIRTSQGLSLRSLAALSGLNINTLSLVENGKNSPSVSTLQQISQALKVPITAFFVSEPEKRKVIFTRKDQGPDALFANARMQSLGKDFVINTIQPFIVDLQSGFHSGEKLIVHAGCEFVYCLEGSVVYSVSGVEYPMNAGDSLLFDAQLSHQWNNPFQEAAKILLVLIPADRAEDLSEHHFSEKKESE